MNESFVYEHPPTEPATPLMTSRRQTLHTLAASLAAIAAGRAFSLAQDAPAHESSKVSTLLQKALPADGNEEVTVLTVDYAPGASSEAHRHPGPVFGYVLEGEVQMQIEGESLKTYAAGQAFYEPRGVVHQVSRNASATKPARFLVFVVAKKGAPIKSPAR